MKKISLRCLALLCLVLMTSEASAWVATRTNYSQTALKWMDTNCLIIRVNTNVNSQIKDGSALAAIKKSADNWVQATESCSYMAIAFLPEKSTALPAFDPNGENENVIYLETSKWQHDGLAAALTTVYFVDKAGAPNDGQIIDADIEMNGTSFSFTTSGELEKTDVQNAITHEMGHVLGIDHLCDDGSRYPLPIDNLGYQIPSCTPASSLPSWIKEATMYNFADHGETIKRTPKSDDIAGICATYPIKSRPPRCQVTAFSDDEGGCGLAPAAPGKRVAAYGFFAACLIVAWAARRRRRRL